jgi:5-methylcytosine-specific restriction endonuclease McrA
MKSPSLISPIGIDLGSKYTGVYFNQYLQGEILTEGDHRGFVVVDNGKKVWMQSERTQRRHSRRSIKRRKLAKRFFMMLNEFVLHLDLSFKVSTGQSLEEFLMGLFNRRGFTRLEEEFDIDFLEENRERVLELLDINVEKQKSIGSIFLEIAQKQELLERCHLKLDESTDKNEKPLKKQIREGLDKTRTSIIEGHKHRKEYLDNILADMKKVLNANMLNGYSVEQLHSLIGNISNFQLRFLRKYFNDIDMTTKDLWKEQKFNDLLNDYLSSWHVKTELEKKNLKQLRFNFSINQGFNFLISSDPVLSIPPYEDQNNRDPQICYSLILTAEKLDQHLEGWERYTRFNEKKTYGMAEKYHRNEIARNIQLYLDSFKESSIKKKVDIILQSVSTHDDERLKEFLNKYYKEIYQSKFGYWGSSDKEDRVLKICGHKTQHKKKMNFLYINQILFTNHFTCQEDIEKFKTDLKNNKPSVGKKRSYFGILEACSTAQKDHGNSLSFLLNKEVDKDLIQLKKDVSDLSTFTEKYLDQKKDQSKKYNNPFSWAQIYNVLDADIHGFSKGCRFCTRDNIHRMELDPTSNEAKAYRLSTVGARPFDGVVDRLLKDISWKVAQEKVKQIKENTAYDKIENVIIPVCIEENKFEFEEGLLEIKKKKSERRPFVSKIDRIKLDARGICAYTGKSLGDKGEIDHIIPRSFTRKNFKTVFNSEANLIYVSGEGNQIKGEKRYSIEDLHPNYKKILWPQKNDSEITNLIIEKIKKILDDHKGSTIHYHHLNDEERVTFRHALFIEEIEDDILRELHKSNRVRVNGTQKYFVSLLEDNLAKLMPEKKITFIPQFVSANDRSLLREYLAVKDPKFNKPEKQQLDSHILDATLTFAWIAKDEDFEEVLHTKGLIFSETDTISLESIIPKKFSIINLEAKTKSGRSNLGANQLFKDGLIGERYLPLLSLKENGVLMWKKGFSKENSITLTKKNIEGIKNITQFLKFKEDSVQTEEKLNSIILNSNFSYFEIDKKSYHDFLGTQKEKGEETDTSIVELMNELYYRTKKRTIRSQISDEKSGKIFDKDKILEALRKDLLIEKKILHPLFQEWEMLIKHLEKIKAFGNKYTDEFVQDFFIQNSTNKNHQAVRKVFSLPVLDNGGNFRIKRSDPKGSNVWQLLNSEGATHKGFVTKDNQILPLYHDAYIKSTRVISLDPMPINDGIKLPVGFFELNNLPKKALDEGVIRFEVSITEQKRRSVRMILKTSLFEKVKNLLQNGVPLDLLGADLIHPREKRIATIFSNDDFSIIEFTHEGSAGLNQLIQKNLS